MFSPRSAYLHLPFCHRRCFYCDFPVVPLGERAGGEPGAPGAHSIAVYLELLHREIALNPGGPPLSTVYFGGGTPSLLTPDQIGGLIAALRQRFGLAPAAEISLELDPASFDQDRLAGYLAVGVNRVSLGGQSFDDAVLVGLSRRHRGQDLALAAGWLAAAQARGCLRSWSLDLIQGLPRLGGGPGLGAGASDHWRGQLDHWRGQLEQALALGPPHLSVYDLSIEPGTVFERRLSRGELDLPDHDLAADLMELTGQRLAGAGYGHYEISNYALPGHASRHNRVYWSGAGWWGFGMGATAAPWGERLARPRTRAAYAAWLEDQSPPPAPGACEGAATGALGMPLDERLMVGLRRREGVAMATLLGEQGWERAAVEASLHSLQQRLADPIAAGLLLLEGGRWRLRDPEGLALSNGVLGELLGWWEELSVGVGPQSSPAGPLSLGHGNPPGAG